MTNQLSSPASELLEELRRLDVRLWREGGRLRFDAPKGVLGADLRARLAEAKGELLARLPDRLQADAAATLPRVSRQGRIPLFYAQRQLWFVHQLDPTSPAYNIPLAIELRGVDLRSVHRAWNEVIRRHEALRTSFPTADGEPVQHIAPPGRRALPVVDLGGLAAGDRSRLADALRRREPFRLFDLARGPVARGLLLRLASDGHQLLLTVHHIVADEWSVRLLATELAALYEAFRRGAPSPLPEPPIQFADYSEWRRAQLTGPALAAHLDYWRRQLAGAPTFLDLPADRPRPAVQTFHGRALARPLPERILAAVEGFAQRHEVTSFMVLLAAFEVLLSRLSRQRDLLVGVPVAGRSRSEVESLIGLFINTLVLRADLGDEPPFLALVERTRSAVVAAFAHQELPFERLIEELQPERTLAHEPVCQVLFQAHAAVALPASPASAPANGQPPGGGPAAASISLLVPRPATATHDLVVALTPIRDVWWSVWTYRTDLFDATTIERWARQYETLLVAAIARPESPTPRLGLLSPAEEQQIRHEWNDTAASFANGKRPVVTTINAQSGYIAGTARSASAPYLERGALDRAGLPSRPWPESATLPELLAAQAADSPDAIAAVFEDEHLSYAGLHARAGALAARLQALGVGPEARVGVCLERSLELLVGLVGVLRAGGAYVPLDAGYPAERLAHMLEDSQAAVLLTTAALVARLPETATPRLLIEDVGASEANELFLAGPAAAANLAYVIYTSGSTGKPKGAMNAHRGIVNRLAWMQAAYRLTASDRVLQKTPTSFDVSVWELFWPLITGACLVVARPDGHRDPAYLAELIARERVTTVHFVPSMLRAFVAEPRLAGCTSLSRVICSGEALPWDLSRELLARTRAELHNLYGPTEAAVDVSFWECRREDERPRVPIGRPIANLALRVLDREGQPVPVGVAGELFLSGVGVGRGYLGRPGLTAERFVPDPLASAGERMYRTGDAARLLADGAVDFLGRLDFQVKIRGFRIELGEIEAALVRLPEVREAVVVATEEGRLVAYLVPAGENLNGRSNFGEALETGELRAVLASQLPEFMVPAFFVWLDRLPLTPNGKLDRKALPAPEGGTREKAFVAPRGAVEERVAGVWAEVLGREAVGAEDDFFALGGHSLLATRVLARLFRAYGVELPVRVLFEAPTVAGMAARIAEALRESRRAAAPPLVPVPRGEALPVSFAQERLWFLDRFEPGTNAYNLSLGVRLGRDLDLAALGRALAALIARHETLRTRIVAVAGSPMQVIDPPGRASLGVVDLSALREPQRPEVSQRLAQRESERPFDLERGPLLRLRLLAEGERGWTLVLGMHHIVSDQLSLQVLVRELTSLYSAFSTGRPSPLAPLTIQYADYAVWERRWLESPAMAEDLAWWARQLAGAPALLELPTDFPRPAVQSFRGADVHRRLPRALGERLGALGRERGATLFMGLLAGFVSLLEKTAGQDDLVVGVPVAGRHRVELEPLIGFFINTLAIRSRLCRDWSFDHLLAEVRATAVEAFARPEVPFERLVEELQPERSLSHAPVFQVVFQLHAGTEGEGEPAAEGSGPEAVPLAVRTAKFDLVVSLWPSGGSLRARWAYRSDLFERTTIERWARHFEALLENAVAMPERALADLPWLLPGEAQQLRAEWNPGLDHQPLRGSLIDLFAAQVATQPDALAVTAEGEAWSYGALARRASTLAVRLAEAGVGRGDLCALLLDRSPDLVVAILGVLTAGAAYVPIDPGYPPERIAATLADSGVAVVVTEPALAGLLPADGPPRLLVGWEGSDTADLPDPAGPDDLAYVIYTSGSTGKPKGVLIPHGAVVRLLAATEPWFRFGPAAVWTLFHSTAFDFSVWELWGALAYGGRLVVVPYRISRSPGEFLALLARERVTVLNQTPSAFRQLDAVEDGAAARESLALDWVLFGGEALEPASLRGWFARHGDRKPRLVNLYGITETTVHVTYRPLGAGDTGRSGSVIGAAIPDLSLRVLDRSGRAAGLGIPGELAVGGAGLAWGYLGRPGLTATRFVPDPFSAEPGARLYRSGDLARALANGDLDYLGRIDQQVKIRGFRIELGEIEAALLAHPRVREAVVVVRKDEAAGGNRLIAYLVPAPAATNLNSGSNFAGELPAADELRAFLAERLPEPMLPEVFVALEALPLNANGKLDRARLPAPAADRPGLATGFVAPRNELERRLAALWGEVLRLDAVGIHDGFFDLGGNSIRGAVLINRIQEELREIVHVVAIFDAPTVAQLAAFLAEQYPRAVARWVGADESVAAEGSASRVGPAELATLRALIEPLAPQPAPATKNPPALFVLSPPRSGTTLLRVMLGGHPSLFAPPELELLSFNTLAERREAFSGRDAFWLEGLLRAVMEIWGLSADEARAWMEQREAANLTTAELYAELQAGLGPRMLVDKTPSYALDLSRLRRAEEVFDGARYLHLIRHPGGMIRSFEEARLEQIFFRREHPFTRRQLAELIWQASHENILAFLADVPAERQLRVGFEDLVRAPEPVLREICSFLGLAYEPAMAEPYQSPAGRMTDGLHAESRMLGDVKFRGHGQVQAGVAERWREEIAESDLGDGTLTLAAELGCEIAATPAAWLPLVPVPRDQPLPLSFAQERLWFLDQLAPGGAAYNVPLAVRLDREVDLEALAASLTAVVGRHEILRTSIEVSAAGPRQRVQAPARIRLPVVDLATLPPPAAQRAAATLAVRQAQRPFDLARGPLLRGLVLELPAGERRVFLALHHIVTDGWSTGLLLRELAEIYTARQHGRPPALPELPVQYADFAVWQRAALAGPRLDGELAFWREQLADAPPLLELPTDRPRPPVLSTRGARLLATAPGEVLAGLRALAQQQGSTLFMTLLAAFAALLHRLSGQTDLVVGTPVAGRPRRELERLIGFFVNTLAVRTEVRPGEPFAALLRRVRARCLGAFAHQDLPFERLVAEIAPERSRSHTPLFQVMLALQNASDPGPGEAGSGGGSSLGFLPPPEVDEQMGMLTLLLSETPDETGLGELRLWLGYNRDLFDRTTMQRWLGSFVRLLRAVAARPEVGVGEIALLSAAERQQLRHEWSDTARPVEVERVPRWLAATARGAPDRVAVIADGERLSYGALDRRVRALAHGLRQRGVGPEVPVALALERSPAQVVGMLAILRAGGTYVPIDPGVPAQRRELTVADSGAALLLSAASLIDLERAGAPAAATAWSEPEISPDHLAYVIYTSGSTGRPKGVAIAHRSLANIVASFVASYRLSAADRVLHQASIGFDVSVNEILPVLGVGGGLVLAAPGQRPGELDLRQRVEEVIRHGVTVLGAAPSLLARLDEAAAELDRVRLVLAGGEALALSDVDHLRRRARVINGYGPTEATIAALSFDLARFVPARMAKIPLGRPLANTAVLLLDRAGREAALGVPAEITLGGLGLARGYLGRPGLTAEAFVPHPWRAGERLYRTGDLGRWGADGNLEFLGRRDEQVKIRGFRIEPGEIAAVLAAHPGLREAVVVVREASPGDRRLVAYAVPAATEVAKAEVDGAEVDVAAVREFLRQRLPAYMVPSAVVLLPALPQTASGKVDRQALPAPPEESDGSAPTGEAAPVDPLIELVAGIWSAVLGRPGLGPDADFFAQGGHSLLATQAISRVRQLCGVEIPLAELFAAPTARAFARRLEGALRLEDGGAGPVVPISLADRARPLPLSFAQQRLWFLARLDPASTAYHMRSAIDLPGDLDVAALAGAFRQVVRRHEALRTRFAEAEGEPVQEIAEPPARWRLPVIDLRGLADADAEAERLARAATARPFDLGHARLLRTHLLRLSPERARLLLVQHHIVSDAWSMEILGRELDTSYRAGAAGREAVLPALPVQYADYAAWQRGDLAGERLAAEVAHWRRELAGLPERLELPADRPRPAVRSGRGRARPWRATPALARDLRATARREGATLFMTLVAGLAATLHRWSGERDLALGVPVAGRTRSELEGLVGFFVNTLVLRVRVDGRATLPELLSTVRRQTLAALAHQEVPFEKLVEELAPARSLAHTPLFQVMASWQSARPAAGEGTRPDSRRPSRAAWATEAKHDLSFFWTDEAAAGEEGIGGVIEHATDLFDDTTIERLGQGLERLLASWLAAPERPLATLGLTSAAERHQLLVEWNPAAVPAGEWEPVPGRFLRQALETPDAVAVVHGEEALSYSALSRAARRLAARLGAAGVAAGAVVGLSATRSLALPAGVLGILLAGGAYLPLDLALPHRRLRFQLADAGVTLALGVAEELPTLGALGVRALAIAPATAEAALDVPVVFSPDVESLAYVLYTSGSTGEPKGVMVSHGAFARYVAAALAAYAPAAGRGAPVHSSLAFDLTVTSLFLPLLSGRRVELVPEAQGIEGLPAALRRGPGQSLVKLTPAHLEILAHTLAPREARGAAARLVVGGEALVWGEGLRFFRRHAPETRILNEYGPTEAVVGCCVFAVTARDGLGPVPIGRPLGGARLLVVDGGGEPALLGSPGELWIGGGALACGYLGRPGLTAERFVPDSWGEQPGARLYRTGDRVRRRADGILDYLGRRDGQIKLRGHRVELGEIEAALRDVPGVAAAAVVLREDVGGDARLVGYFVGEVAATAVLAGLRERLPAALVPAQLVALAELPLTVNGKVDRQALPAPPGLPGEGTGEPRGALEKRVAAIFVDLLGVEGIGRRDDFFARGGHSLLAVRLLARLAADLGRQLPLSAIFQAPTVEALSRRLGDDEAAASPLVAFQAGGSRPPILAVHGIDGDVQVYHELARQLGEEQPFYALEAPEPEAEVLADLPRLADFYLRAAERPRPVGPYVLLGWSFGCVVAFEMAQQLRRRGAAVPLLVLLDGYAPGSRPLNTETSGAESLVDEDRANETGADEMGADETGAEGPEDLAVLGRLLARQARRLGLDFRPDLTAAGLAGLVRAAQAGGLIASDTEIVPLLARARGARRRLLALGAYTPASYPGRALFVRAADERSTAPAPELAAAWRPLVEGGFETATFACEHAALLRSPIVEPLSDLLRDRITRALEDLP